MIRIDYFYVFVFKVDNNQLNFQSMLEMVVENFGIPCDLFHTSTSGLLQLIKYFSPAGLLENNIKGST
jgi:hypothetical protein